MFDKTRRKIVFTVVISLLALLLVTLSTIYWSNRIALRHENEMMLQTYAARYSLDAETPAAGERDLPWPAADGQPPEGTGALPPDAPDGKGPMKNEPMFRLSTFYSVAYDSSGEVLALRNGNDGMQSDASLLEIASYALRSGKQSGSKDNIFYLVSEREDCTLVAMIDSTIGDRSQQRLFRELLIIGAAATAILILISIFLARRIVRPLEENDKRQKRFVSDAGHELKTPLAVISANSELLKRQFGENEWLSNIDYENERMSDLVRQLLLLSKAENGELPKETLDFSKLVDGEILPFESLAFEKGKRIVSEVEPGLSVEGEPGQLRQLVSILIDNAISHGTGEEIEVSLRRERHAALLSVANEAEEIGAEQLSHLFDRFYRMEEARGAEDGHFGLGLSIAQAVAASHGGQIRAAYQRPKAIFKVSLPLKK